MDSEMLGGVRIDGQKPHGVCPVLTALLDGLLWQCRALAATSEFGTVTHYESSEMDDPGFVIVTSDEDLYSVALAAIAAYQQERGY